MVESIRPSVIDATPPRRHDGRVMRESADYARLRRLDHLVVGDSEASSIVDAVCVAIGIPAPRLKFHARRSPFTGACEAPRGTPRDGLSVAGTGMEASTPVLSEYGAIRLGRTVTLMTLAHELGHHLVHHLDTPGTASHGRVWVHRFDEAAAAIDELIDGEQDPTRG